MFSSTACLQQLELSCLKSLCKSQIIVRMVCILLQDQQSDSGSLDVRNLSCSQFRLLPVQASVQEHSLSSYVVIHAGILNQQICFATVATEIIFSWIYCFIAASWGANCAIWSRLLLLNLRDMTFKFFLLIQKIYMLLGWTAWCIIVYKWRALGCCQCISYYWFESYTATAQCW